MRRLFIIVPIVAIAVSMVAAAQKPKDEAAIKLAQEQADAAKAAAKQAEDKAAAEAKHAAEQLLVQALQNSPEVQVAEAKLKEAEAILRQARMQVAQRAMELQSSREQKQVALTLLRLQYDQIAKQRAAGTVPASELNKVEADLASQKAQIAQIEAQVNMLTGKLPNLVERTGVLFEASGPARREGLFLGHHVGAQRQNDGIGAGMTSEPDARRMPNPAMAEKLRKLLNSPYKGMVNFKAMPVTEIFAHVRESTGAPILAKNFGEADPVSLQFIGEISLGAFFQMLCDVVPNLQICVRDYGFLAFIDSPPDDAILFMDFWHAKEKPGK